MASQLITDSNLLQAQFLEAAEAGQDNRVAELLSKGADPSAGGPSADSGLFWRSASDALLGIAQPSRVGGQGQSRGLARRGPQGISRADDLRLDGAFRMRGPIGAARPCVCHTLGHFLGRNLWPH